MNKLSEKSQGNEANTLLPAGDLERGDHFKLRKNGKWYTVHEKVKAVRHGDTCFNGDFYLIAVCSKQKMWVHSLTNVFACR